MRKLEDVQVELEELTRRFAAAPAASSKHYKTSAEGARLQARARRIATAVGLPIPDWANVQRPRAAKLAFLTEPKPKPAPGTARPVELDALLSDWRKARPGSIVHVGQHGVTLHEFGADPLKFDTPEAALDWLTNPTRPS